MARSKNSRKGLRGSGNTTKDLVGRGANYESKTPVNKRVLRRKNRKKLRDKLAAEMGTE